MPERDGSDEQQTPTGQKDDDVKGKWALRLMAALKISTEDGGIVPAFAPKRVK